MSSYQTLYRKYRSQTFADLVGQDAISRALRGALVSGRVVQAYLFSGSRGTGKTSAARLLAKAINCTARAPEDAEPCNACDCCLSVMAGTALDLIEIDAASNRGIDEIRDLREKVHLSPALGKRKVYIIDEAHMLTTEAFNALLKTLEEPPDHVVFILCTTEGQKVPATVRSRCQHFLFQRHADEQIVARLAHIAAAEGFQVDSSALELIARTAQGSLRDAVGLLDQVVPLADGPITLELARQLLGIADPILIDELLDLVLAGHGGRALTALGSIYEGGAELRQIVRSLMERTRDRLVTAIERRDERGRLQLAGVLDDLLHLDGEVRRHAEPRFLVEATLVRLSVEAPPELLTVTPSAPAPLPVLVAAPPAIEAPPPPTAAASPAVPASSGRPDLDMRWRGLLDSLKPNVKGMLREGRPQLVGDTLVLSFRYNFHHKWAHDHAAEIAGLVRPALGTDKLEFRLLDEKPAPAQPPAAPEEHPVVQEVVRQLEGQVTRVREIRT